MPPDGDPSKISEIKLLSFLVAGQGRVYFYSGDEKEAVLNNKVYPANYSVHNGSGKIIRQKQLWLLNHRIDKKELFVLIKPAKEADYKNLVDLLDEMLINGVSRYAIVEPGEYDLAFLK